jgi:RimJ/RimL family protein N-acetyltransferase
MSVVLNTKRLVLRPIGLADVAAFVPLLDDFDVAKNLAPVPHPYTEQLGREFIARTEIRRAAGDVMNLAVALRDGTFIGFCTANAHDDGDEPMGREEGILELGYWYGKRYWNKGFATEAARAVVRHAFADLGAKALSSGWFSGNPASGRVLEKLGFERVGQADRYCVARDCTVVSNRVLLTRVAFEGRAER